MLRKLFDGALALTSAVGAFSQFRRFCLIHSHLLLFDRSAPLCSGHVTSLSRTLGVCWSLMEAFRVFLQGFFRPRWERFPYLKVSINNSVVSFHQTFWWHAEPILSVPALEEYVCCASLSSLRFLCQGIATWSPGVSSDSLRGSVKSFIMILINSHGFACI